MASLRALLAAVNARDSYTATHAREVVTLARGVARRLELDESQASEVEHIALLHDLGKIAVPDAILRKAGPLTYHEQTLMRQHPVVGAEILASMPELAHLAPALRAEHGTMGRRRLPRRLVRRADPDCEPDRAGLRRLPRDDVNPPVPPGHVGDRRARGDPA